MCLIAQRIIDRKLDPKHILSTSKYKIALNKQEPMKTIVN